ncbi:hypothetical protein HN371_04465 [Candidatus Poribacteria bacterium]|jgi:hypothetical protein|nr:hypothetical protein [Candidatus Poribacteria bacterium]MBT5535556.1 hypothetical protein [Candidatus Poribacteria bacterium]MBT5712467.1 hypothetical protein [Candidatus Poribacteria bacterium]MBT7096408.1 hypothetical protein [Candidatus Poribacteria bacterium]MBT7804047.1 hypothetical protein [Candidatus Poribacteria bacterium]
MRREFDSIRLWPRPPAQPPITALARPAFAVLVASLVVVRMLGCVWVATSAGWAGEADPLAHPEAILLLAGSWSVVWIVAILFAVNVYQLPWREAFRRLPAWTFAVILAAAWPLSLLHSGEVALWHRPRVGGIGREFASGISSLLDAAKGAPGWISALAVATVVAMAVLQVVLFIGLDKPTGLDRWPARAWHGYAFLVVALFAFDSAGFPVTTTVALAVAYSLTRTVIAPITLVVGLCVFLWL